MGHRRDDQDFQYPPTEEDEVVVPFFLYEIREGDSNDCSVFDAIFWAASKEEAEERIFADVLSVAECWAASLAELGGEPGVVDEGADRCVDVWAASSGPEDEGGMVRSWMVGDPEVHETRPDKVSYHGSWVVGDN